MTRGLLGFLADFLPFIFAFYGLIRLSKDKQEAIFFILYAIFLRLC